MTPDDIYIKGERTARAVSEDSARAYVLSVCALECDTEYPLSTGDQRALAHGNIDPVAASAWAWAWDHGYFDADACDPLYSDDDAAAIVSKVAEAIAARLVQWMLATPRLSGVSSEKERQAALAKPCTECFGTGRTRSVICPQPSSRIGGPDTLRLARVIEAYCHPCGGGGLVTSWATVAVFLDWLFSQGWTMDELHAHRERRE